MAPTPVNRYRDGQEHPCRLQADFVGNERILGRDVLNRLEMLFRGPAGEVIVNNLGGAAFDVYGRKLALVLDLEMGQNVILVDRVATPGKRFFTVTAFGSGHELPPFLRAGIESDSFYSTRLIRCRGIEDTGGVEG